MVRTKTLTRAAGRCLIALALTLSFSLQATGHKLGTITQIDGEVTYLNFMPPHALKQVKMKNHLLTDGSYLTQDNSFFTVKLFDGSWLRVSPKSKIAFEFTPDNKTLTIHLFSGSLKTLFSSELNNKKLEKLVIRSAGATFETVEGKFTVSRNTVNDVSSVYVEKGTVIASQYVLNDKKDMELVHARETTAINDRDTDIESPRKMTDKEIKFLHPSFYLKKTQQNL